MSLPTTSLPYAHLESMRSKATQIIDSLQSLHQLLAIDQPQIPYMPPWPEVLAKYNLLLSQTHSFSASLSPIVAVSAAAALQGNFTQNNNTNAAGGSPYERMSLHPTTALSDGQIDTDLVPLLRNQQTNDVLKMENDIVRRLAQAMSTKGSIGVLTSSSSTSGRPLKQPTTYTDVLSECADIRVEHDKSADRAIRAVMMLRERFEWKARVEVEVEEPEELEWDPRLGPMPGSGAKEGGETLPAMEVDEDEESSGSSEEEEPLALRGNGREEDDSSGDEQSVEGALTSTGLTPA